MDSRKPVVTAFIANLLITLIKLAVGLYSRSAGVIAETVHSLSDTFNQLFLLAGLELSAKPPTEKHPFGRGKEQFFWSFVAAVSVFSLSALFSLIRGAEELMNPSVPKNIYTSIMILIAMALLEGYALTVTYRKIKGRATNMKVKGIMGFFSVSKDPIILTAFLEDVVAIAGVAVAAIGLYLSHIFQNGVFDASASIVIGLMLAGYGVVIALESRDLLLGEGLSRADIAKLIKLVEKIPEVESVLDVRGVYFGPGKVVLGVDISFKDGLVTSEIERATDSIEKIIKGNFPQIQYIYVEAENSLAVKLNKEKERKLTEYTSE